MSAWFFTKPNLSRAAFACIEGYKFAPPNAICIGRHMVDTHTTVRTAHRNTPGSCRKNGFTVPLTFNSKGISLEILLKSKKNATIIQLPKCNILRRFAY